MKKDLQRKEVVGKEIIANKANTFGKNAQQLGAYVND